MFLPGESVNLGIGGESQAARGTPVAPSVWIKGRTPTGIRIIVEKTLLRETTASGVMSHASEIVQKRAEGDHEFNVRVNSIGWIFQSLLGSSSSVSKGGANAAVYDTTFGVLLNNPQHPSLTLALRQPGVQDYEYAMALVNSLEIRTPVNDLVNATAGFIAKSEAEHAAYTVAFNEAADRYFRNHDLVIKLANDVAGLDAAPNLGRQDFSLLINNNGRPHYTGDDEPTDVIAGLLEIGGSLKLDYTAKTYHDIFTAGTYKAMRIEMTRSDVVIGASANPKIVIDLPKVSFENLTPDRPLDDIVTEDISFAAHYDSTTAKAISVVVTNLIPSYNVA